MDIGTIGSIAVDVTIRPLAVGDTVVDGGAVDGLIGATINRPAIDEGSNPAIILGGVPIPVGGEGEGYVECCYCSGSYYQPFHQAAGLPWTQHRP